MLLIENVVDEAPAMRGETHHTPLILAMSSGNEPIRPNCNL